MRKRVELYHEIVNSKKINCFSEDEIAKKKAEYLDALGLFQKRSEEMQLINLIMSFRILFFGSARLDEQDQSGDFIHNLTQALVTQREFDIVTGGGFGIMGRANGGLKMVKNNSKSTNYGILLDVPHEDQGNPHLDFSSKHNTVGTRLQEMIGMSHGAYCGPGGIGTTVELLFIPQLQQISHLEREFTLIAHPDWEPIVNILWSNLYKKRVETEKQPMINENLFDQILFSDDIPTIVDSFTSAYDYWKKNINNKFQII